MPTVTLHPPPKTSGNAASQPLPSLLQTPSGLAIVEIQGTLNTPSADGSATSAAQPVGRIAFPLYDSKMAKDDITWHKRVHLYVGKHQRLTGEVKKLRNPIAVIRRKQHVDETHAASESTELEIADIVYYKLLFAQRPEPVGGGAP